MNLLSDSKDQLISFNLLFFSQKSSRTRELDNDYDDDSENEPKVCQSRKRSADQLSSSTVTLNKMNTSIQPNQNLVKCLEPPASRPGTKNGHYELVDMNTTHPSGPSLKRNATITYKMGNFESQWSSDGVNLADTKTSNQTTSMINLSNNIVNNNNNTSINGNSQLHSNQYTARGTRSHPKSVSTRISSLKRENKTTRTLSIVVGGFIACWFPFFIYYLLIPFIPSQYVSSTLQAVLTWLGWTNSAINPFIYAFYSVDFRAAFWRLTLRRFFKANKKSPYPINSFSTRQKS